MNNEAPRIAVKSVLDEAVFYYGHSFFVSFVFAATELHFGLRVGRFYFPASADKYLLDWFFMSLAIGFPGKIFFPR